jgi:hypothetical protein
MSETTEEYTILITQELSHRQLSLILDFLDGLIDPENITITVTDVTKA